MVGLHLYVEGGGDTAHLRSECRRGFSRFLEKAGLRGHLPRIVACGSRGQAFDKFCTAVQSGQPALLLVDSEAPVAASATDTAAWAHLAARPGDGWVRPATAGENSCHLMVQCMEAWLLADRGTLRRYFGQGFNEAALPAPTRGIETIARDDLFAALAAATRGTKTKGGYSKGAHSFALLALTDPGKVTAASLHAARFTACLKQRMGADT